MINKLKKLYPNYLILIKENKKIYDINKNEIIDLSILKDTNYIIVKKESYEVHKKMKP